jgi:hypothetical protein
MRISGLSTSVDEASRTFPANIADEDDEHGTIAAAHQLFFKIANPSVSPNEQKGTLITYAAEAARISCLFAPEKPGQE